MRKKLLLIGALASLFCFACNKPYTTNTKADQNTLNKADPSIYPHSDDFKKKSHGSFYLKDKTQCLACHGLDLKGANSKVSCTQCHSLFPHTTNWAMPTQHGKAFKALDGVSRVDQCLKCHTSVNSNTSNEKLVCATCHEAYPHQLIPDFETTHMDESSIAGKFKGQCLICHRDMKQALPSHPEGCNECHKDQILGINWRNPRPNKGEVPPDGVVAVNIDKSKRAVATVKKTEPASQKK